MKYLSEKEPRSAFIDKVVTSIALFKPFSNYKLENQYQIDLARYLQNEYPDAKIEQRRGHSRPDIVIENVAIEVKGPTTIGALDTIPGKIIKYDRDMFAGMIVVLFNLRADMEYYHDWKERVLEQFPHIRFVVIN